MNRSYSQRQEIDCSCFDFGPRNIPASQHNPTHFRPFKKVFNQNFLYKNQVIKPQTPNYGFKKSLKRASANQSLNSSFSSIHQKQNKGRLNQTPLNLLTRQNKQITALELSKKLNQKQKCEFQKSNNQPIYQIKQQVYNINVFAYPHAQVTPKANNPQNFQIFQKQSQQISQQSQRSKFIKRNSQVLSLKDLKNLNNIQIIVNGIPEINKSQNERQVVCQDKKLQRKASRKSKKSNLSSFVINEAIQNQTKDYCYEYDSKQSSALTSKIERKPSKISKNLDALQIQSQLTTIKKNNNKKVSIVDKWQGEGPTQTIQLKQFKRKVSRESSRDRNRVSIKVSPSDLKKLIFLKQAESVQSISQISSEQSEVIQKGRSTWAPTTFKKVPGKRFVSSLNLRQFPTPVNCNQKIIQGIRYQ